MTFGAAPNDFGWDGGTLFPDEVSQTSFGQSWINFVHHPLGGVLRLIAIAGIAGLVYKLVPPSEQRSARASSGHAAQAEGAVLP
jgi:hypothetical protein